MATHTTEWILKFIDKATQPMREVTRGAGKLGNALDQVRAIDYYAVTEALQTVNNVMQKAVQPALRYEDALADVEAMTGVTGKALDHLGGLAKSSAVEFGGRASDSLNTYKKILSQLSPELAKSPKALAEMEHHARILSKTMGNDLGAATEALNTAMLQYNVDLSDATKASGTMERMMNTMAAGAKEGTAEVSDVAAALKVAGVQAYTSKVSFAEMNSAVQLLAKGGKQGAEAGTALRNVLGKMAGADVLPKEALDKLNALGVNMDVVSDKTLPFTARLRELKKAEADATIYAEMFGVENAAAARILIRSIDAQEELTQKITGTNSAYEQAEVKMDTWSETMARVRARIDNVLISIGGTVKYVLPAVQLFTGLGQAVATVGIIKTGLLPILGFTKKGLEGESRAATKTSGSFLGLSTATSILTPAQIAATVSSWSLAGGIRAIGIAIKSIPIIGWILAAISALIGLFTYLWNTSATFRGIIKGLWEIVSTVFGKIWGFVKPILFGLFNFFKEKVQGMWVIAKVVFGFLKDRVVGVFTSIWNTIKNVVTNIWNFLKPGLEFIYNLFDTIFGDLFEKVDETFGKVWKSILGFMKDLVNSPLAKHLSQLFGFSLKTIQLKIAEEEAKMDAEDDKTDPGPKVFDFAGGDDLFNAGGGGTDTGTGTSGGSPSTGGSSSGGKILSMVLNVENNFNVKDGADFMKRRDEILNYIVGRMNDTMKDALIVAG